MHIENLRQRIRHENELINQRMGWLLQFEGFLFAGFSVFGNAHKTVVWPIGVLGICAAASAFVAMRCALNAIRKIESLTQSRWSESQEQKDDSDIVDYNLKGIPEVFYYRTSKSKSSEKLSETLSRLAANFFLPWNLLPLALIIAWLAIIRITL